jgi:hypothetical protein
MNHTTLLTIGMIVAAVSLIVAVGISVPTALATKYSKDPKTDNNKYKNNYAKRPSSALDYENSETDFNFKQKLKNNCSGFSVCTNTGTQTLAGV